ncbi:hypothetical protein BKA82DRAFT_1006349 [Pisolithus tinctorius]|uniref:Mid2 domain-containing protein n=1 Tax=Pisolithus tinctorius Marx 270 TaxID=870435 RepID=A0A0C3NN67_PISTI|nr:hypothetical protein BKA82DRAFT_1006349 [Pisolithus tinctorius]KIN97075.1 hypothetical protein M404DRAFT_1006349 [Pisolithus tinctorius Marx 270]
MVQILASCVSLVLSLCLYTTLISQACAQQIVVLSSNDSDIIYNPPLCSSSDVVSGCISPWQLLNDSSASTTVISTSGPIPQAGNVIPQMFLTFRASSLYLYPSPLSNATVNFTLTAEPSDTSITSMVNTSINIITAVGLPLTQATTLGITFIPGDLPTRFDVESITLVVANASATASYLPSPLLPSSSSPPLFTSSSTPTSAHTSSGVSEVTILGATLGSVLGGFVILVIVLSVALYRRRVKCRTAW